MRSCAHPFHTDRHQLVCVLVLGGTPAFLISTKSVEDCLGPHRFDFARLVAVIVFVVVAVTHPQTLTGLTHGRFELLRRSDEISIFIIIIVTGVPWFWLPRVPSPRRNFLGGIHPSGGSSMLSKRDWDMTGDAIVLATQSKVTTQLASKFFLKSCESWTSFKSHWQFLVSSSNNDVFSWYPVVTMTSRAYDIRFQEFLSRLVPTLSVLIGLEYLRECN